MSLEKQQKSTPKQPTTHHLNPQITQIKKNQVQYSFDYLQTPHVSMHEPKKRALVLRGPNYSKHLYPLYKDKEIGFSHEFQDQIHSSYNDDDRMTTTTQIHLAMSQTYQDLIESIQGPQRQAKNYFNSQ